MPLFLKVRIRCELCEETIECEAETMHQFRTEGEKFWDESELSFDESSVILPNGWVEKNQGFYCFEHRNGV